MQANRARAFTLIELLSVIAIIGILAAILIPTVGAVRSRARTAQCLSNLRQIATALNLYADDNRGRYPIAGATIAFTPGQPTTSGPVSWTEQVFSYAGGNEAIFRCEESSRELPQNTRWGYFIGSHAAYAQLGGFGAVQLGRIATPSRHILAGDATAIFAPEDADRDDYTQNAGFGLSPVPIHGGRINIAFGDGHVESLTAFDPARHAIRYEGPGFNYP